jgi:hypothetical protein
MKVLRISARRDGYRRAGIAHFKQAVDHPIEAFSSAQFDQLFGDPNLLVAIVDLAAEKAAALDQAGRDAAIRAAVATLGADDLTADGKPKIAALAKIVGFDTSRAEIDAALAPSAG